MNFLESRIGTFDLFGAIADGTPFIRYCFEHAADAERFLRDFQERLAKFGLEIHPEKTRLIAFGRFAVSDCRKRGKGKPETFAFLGFTHYCGTNSKGHFVVWRRTLVKRMRAKLHTIKQELRRKMHEPVAVSERG